jgi:hypothetical protein
MAAETRFRATGTYPPRASMHLQTDPKAETTP